jgi:hypothetical protein
MWCTYSQLTVQGGSHSICDMHKMHPRVHQTRPPAWNKIKKVTGNSDWRHHITYIDIAAQRALIRILNRQAAAKADEPPGSSGARLYKLT